VERWQVGELGIPRRSRLAVVSVPTATVLVGEAAPAPVRERRARDDPKGVDWVDALRSDRAEVGPVIAKVEDVREMFPQCQPAEPGSPVVEDRTELLPVFICVVSLVPSASLNSWRWARSQRAKASSMASASCAKV
jgi:hypothetical protein